MFEDLKEVPKYFKEGNHECDWLLWFLYELRALILSETPNGVLSDLR